MKLKVLLLFTLIFAILTASACGESIDPVEKNNNESATKEIQAETPDTENRTEKDHSEDALIGVWESNDNVYGEVIKHYCFSFNNINGSYIGTYTVDTPNAHTEQMSCEHTVFEYRINNGLLEFITDNETIKTETFSLNNDTFTYQGMDYTKSDYLEPFGAAPTDEDYRYLFTDSLGLDVIDEGELSNIYVMGSAYNERYNGEPEKYTTVDMDSDGIKEILVQYSGRGDVAVIRWEYGEWKAFHSSCEELRELKTDGTMSVSGSDSSETILKFVFQNGQMRSMKLCEYGGTNAPYYRADGFACSEEFMQTHTEQMSQGDKQNVVWKDIPDMIALREGTADIQV